MLGVSAPVNWSNDAITLITVLRWSLVVKALVTAVRDSGFGRKPGWRRSAMMQFPSSSYKEAGFVNSAAVLIDPAGLQ
jgi:hypothetical protein